MSIHQSDALSMLAEVSTSPVSINSDESTIEQDIIDTAINDVVLVTETTVSSLEDIANGNFSDMELSEHEINLVSTRKSASLKPRLVSIKGICTENITIAVLRRFLTSDHGDSSSNDSQASLLDVILGLGDRVDGTKSRQTIALGKLAGFEIRNERYKIEQGEDDCVESAVQQKKRRTY